MTLEHKQLQVLSEKIQSFPLHRASLTSPYFVNAFNKELQYLKRYEPERLLAGFRETRGLPVQADKYPGWESTEIRGHTLGHYLSALSQAYQSTQDSELLERLNKLIDGLAACQHENGYVSAFPEKLFDHIENKQPAWVPWYTMHKIIAGLIAAYRATGSSTAYNTVSALGDWVYRRASAWSPEIQERVLAVEYGGMNDCLYELYKVTKQERHLVAAHQFDELSLFTPIHEGRDILKGKHANTTIPKFLGALNRYLVLGESERFYLEAAERFWEMVVVHHSYITGGNSEWEHFGDPDILDAERSNFTAETCNTYNMLKLTRELFMLTGDPKYTDFYENTFINAILSSQNPHSGMTMYFQPMATGYFKVYSSPFDHFWCCTGTGMESFTKLNDSLYFYRGSRLYVNLYVSSTLVSDVHGIELVQSSLLPQQDSAELTIHVPQGEKKALALHLRLPSWLAEPARIEVNGEPASYAAAGGYAVLDRTWSHGDQVKITLPMKPTWHALPDAPHVVAFKYGPVVLSAALGKEDMTSSATGVAVSVPTKRMPVKDFITVSGEQNIGEWLAQFEQHFVRQNEELVFALRGTDEDERLRFTPHYAQHEERYGIYWKLVEADSKELQDHILQGKLARAIDEATVDSLPVGNDQYELEHKIQGENTSVAVWDGFTTRRAGQGGWFSYRLKVLPQQDNYLSVTYFSGDNGKRLDIFVNGKLLVSERLMTERFRSFYTKRYLVPADWMEGASEIEVKFAAPETDNGIYDLLRLMTAFDSNAALNRLGFDTGELSKTFAPEQYEYSLTVPAGQASVQMTAAPAHHNARVCVNGILIDDTAPRSIPLHDAVTSVSILVTAEDGEHSREYKVTIVKSAS